MFGPNMPKACFRGVTGFDKEFSVYVRAAKLLYLFKLQQTSSANKVARGILSPIQVADLGLVFS